MGCHFVATQITELASHAQEQHIEPVKCSDVFVCLWQGCKVYNRPSCSMTWFTKHLESHIGVKPFKCVIDGCSMSFSSQTGLARHVPCHFEDSVRPIKRTTTTGKEESPNKKHLKRKRLKYIRYKKANCHGKKTPRTSLSVTQLGRGELRENHPPANSTRRGYWLENCNLATILISEINVTCNFFGMFVISSLRKISHPLGKFHSKLVKKNSDSPRFSTRFSVSRNRRKNTNSCLKHYMKYKICYNTCVVSEFLKNYIRGKVA